MQPEILLISYLTLRLVNILYYTKYKLGFISIEMRSSKIKNNNFKSNHNRQTFSALARIIHNFRQVVNFFSSEKLNAISLLAYLPVKGLLYRVLSVILCFFIIFSFKPRFGILFPLILFQSRCRSLGHKVTSKENRPAQ